MILFISCSLFIVTAVVPTSHSYFGYFSLCSSQDCLAFFACSKVKTCLSSFPGQTFYYFKAAKSADRQIYVVQELKIFGKCSVRLKYLLKGN